MIILNIPFASIEQLILEYVISHRFLKDLNQTHPHPMKNMIAA